MKDYFLVLLMSNRPASGDIIFLSKNTTAISLELDAKDIRETIRAMTFVYSL
jgi:hypothetical protein